MNKGVSEKVLKILAKYSKDEKSVEEIKRLLIIPIMRMFKRIVRVCDTKNANVSIVRKLALG